MEQGHARHAARGVGHSGRVARPAGARHAGGEAMKRLRMRGGKLLGAWVIEVPAVAKGRVRRRVRRAPWLGALLVARFCFGFWVRFMSAGETSSGVLFVAAPGPPTQRR